MGKLNAIDLDCTNNADGFDCAGGTTKRKLTVTGADITCTGAGTNTYTFPASSGVLTSRNSIDVLTNKETTGLVMTAGTTAVAPLYLNAGTNLTTLVDGAVEWDGTKLYVTNQTGTNGRLRVMLGQTCHLTGNVSFTNTTVGEDITGLALAIPAGGTWIFRFDISSESSTGAGYQVSVDVPASSTLAALCMGAAAGPGTMQTNRLTADNGFSTDSFNRFSSTESLIVITGTVIAAAAGNIQVRMKKTTGGTGTCHAGSNGIVVLG